MTSGTVIPLELRHIGQKFGRKVVLREVDLRVAPGEVVGLIGANGAGKTTLLTIVAGLQQPTSGERRLGESGGREVDIEQRARLAFVAHTPQVYPRLTARENLELFRDLRAATVASPAESPASSLARMGLEAVADQVAGTFSRGMLQRLALARALAGRPELLLLDEPFTGLDRDGRALLVRVLREEGDRGAAVLLCSHDLAAVEAVADRVALLEGGRLVGQVARGAQQQESGFGERLADLAGGAQLA